MQRLAIRLTPPLPPQKKSRAIKNAASPACFLTCSMLMPILAGKEPWQVVVPLHIGTIGCMVDMIDMVIVVSGYLVILDSVCCVQFSLVLVFVSNLTLSCVFVATRFIL